MRIFSSPGTTWIAFHLGLAGLIGIATGCSDDDTNQPPKNCFDFDGWVLPDAGQPDADAGTDAEVEVDASYAKVTVLHTTDLHNHASGYTRFADYTPMDPSDQDQVTGGYARIATKIRETRAQQDASGIPVLLFDTGDFTMGTVYDMVIEDPISLRFFDMMQYTAVNIGNHEYDYSPEGLALIVNNALDSPLGFHVPLLASNTVTDSSPLATGDDGVEELFAEGVIRRKLVLDLPNGLRVGVLGLLGENADTSAPLAGPVTFDHSIPYIQGLVDELRQQDGVHMVIIVSHGGIHANGSGDDTLLAAQVDGINLILSGHYHELTPEAYRVNGAVIYIAAQYGEQLSRLDADFDMTHGRLDNFELTMIPIDDGVTGDATVHSTVESYDATLNGLLLDALGLDLRSPIVEVPFDLPSVNGREGGLCNLAADSVRYAATYFSYALGDPNYNFSVAAFPSGSARDSLLRSNAGYASFADVYNVVPLGISPDPENQNMLGWPIVAFYVTPKELKAMAEVSVSVVPSMGVSDAFVCFSGMRVRYDPNGSTIPPNRVRELWLCGNSFPVEFGGDGDQYSLDCDVQLDIEDETTLYRIVTDLYSALFAVVMEEQVGLSIKPKFEDGTPIIGSDMMDIMAARLDLDGDPGNGSIMEMKSWVALMFYLIEGGFPDNGGIPDLKEIPNVYDVVGIANGRFQAL